MSTFELPISSRAQALKPSGIRRFFDLLENRKDAISLGIGEPDFLTPWEIRDAGIYSLEKGYTKYTPNAGMTRLREECSLYMKRRFSLEYQVSEILVTVGGSEALDLCVRSSLNPLDEVLIPEPCFVAYAPIVSLAGGVPVAVPTLEEHAFRLTAQQVKKALTPKTKMLVLPFPCNPTGAVLERKDLEALADVLRDTNILVLSDEIYAELTYVDKHISIAAIPGMKERTLIVGGLSKSHAMTGWRMGFAYGPQALIAQMTKIHQFAIMSAPTTSQYAAITALRDGDEHILRMREEYNRRRLLMLSELKRLELPCFDALGAFYLFPNIQKTGLSSETFCQQLLEQESLAAIPGSAFGDSGEGFIRICYAVSLEQLKEAVIRLERFLGRL